MPWDKSMTETEFLHHVTQVWSEIESRVDAWASKHDLDIETIRVGSVLEIEFESGRKIVINPQTPMLQIWLASPRGAYHFQWRDGLWKDTRQATDFWSVLGEQASLEAGVALGA
jgi:CyaY protein